MNFYTSDNHFFHRKIIQYQDRPFSTVEEMNDEMIVKWNKKVKPEDNVYILGDFALTSGINANELLQKLNGRKHLIKGNHDYGFLNDKDFDHSLFVWIKSYEMIEDAGRSIVLFHYPIASWNKQHYSSLHFYGHIHNNAKTPHPLMLDLKNAFNVGVDVNDFEPKTLNEILENQVKS